MSNFVLISDLIILYHFPAGIATSWRGNFWMAQVAGGWAGLAGGWGLPAGVSACGGGWLGSLAAGVSACAGGWLGLAGCGWLGWLRLGHRAGLRLAWLAGVAGSAREAACWLRLGDLSQLAGVPASAWGLARLGLGRVVGVLSARSQSVLVSASCLGCRSAQGRP